jgi:hypothetical protein
MKTAKIDHARLAKNLGATRVGRVTAGAGYFGALQTVEEVRRLKRACKSRRMRRSGKTAAGRSTIG